MKKQTKLYLLLSFMIFGTVLANADNILLNPGFEVKGVERTGEPWGAPPADWDDLSSKCWWNDDPQYAYSGTGSVQCNGWGEWGQVKQSYESVMLNNQTVTATVWAMIPSFVPGTTDPTIISNGWNGAVLSIMETGFAEPLATTNFVNSDSEKGIWHKGTVIADLYPDTDQIEILLQCAADPDWTYCQTPVFFDNASLDVVIPEPGILLSFLSLQLLWSGRKN